VVDRKIQPLTCSPRCTADERYYSDAMLSVFQRCEWLLEEAMPLRADVLPG
jgi:hypothetical protein